MTGHDGLIKDKKISQILIITDSSILQAVKKARNMNQVEMTSFFAGHVSLIMRH